MAGDRLEAARRISTAPDEAPDQDVRMARATAGPLRTGRRSRTPPAGTRTPGVPATGGTPGPAGTTAQCRPSQRHARLRPVPLARHLAAVLVFAIPGVVLWWHAWDGHLGSVLTCTCGDPGQTVWFTAWPAYAVAHGLDPFFSGAVQAPYGVNLLNNASAVPVGIVLAPLTWAAGPVASTNVALTLCPALSAWACWVAARRLVHWNVAAVAAGLLYGYSPFVVDNLALGHVSVTLLVVPPLLVVAARELLVGPAAPRPAWAAWAGALLAFQFVLSGEVLAVIAVVGGPTFVAAWLMAGSARPPVSELVRPLALGALVGACLLAVPVWFFAAGAQHISGPVWHAVGVGNPISGLWDPGAYRSGVTALESLGGYKGRRGPPEAYLGPVVIAGLVASVWCTWRRRAARILVLAALVGLVCSFGAAWFVSPGHALTSWAPWRLVAAWPLLDDVIPQRFSLAVDLCVALLVGVGLDRARAILTGAGRRARRVGVPAVAIAALLVCCSTWWTFQVPFATRSVDVPVWFTLDAPHRAASTVLLTYPFPYPAAGTSGPMVWQAAAGFAFRLAGGYVKAPAPDGHPLAQDPSRQPYAFLSALSSRAGGPPPRVTPAVRRSLWAALRRWHVAEVVVVDRGRDPALAVQAFSTVLGRDPVLQRGAWVWALLPVRSTAEQRPAPAP